MSNLLSLNYSQFQDLFATNEIYFLDFYADWCGPCRMMSPVLESFAGSPEFSRIKFAKVDVDSEPEFGQEFGVRSIPAFFLVKFNGKGFEKIGNWVGGQDSLTFGDKILKTAQEYQTNSDNDNSKPQNNITNFDRKNEEKKEEIEEKSDESVGTLGSNSREI